MKSNVVSLHGRRIDRSGDAGIGGGVYGLARGMAVRIRLLLDLAGIREPEKMKSYPPGYFPIVRGRTVRRTMKALGRRGEALESKIQELRKEPEKFRLVIRIFVSLVMLKIEGKEPGSEIPEERVEAIIGAMPFEGHEIDSILEILQNFALTRKEVFQTIRGDTAKMIRAIDYDDVYTFLKNLRNQ